MALSTRLPIRGRALLASGALLVAAAGDALAEPTVIQQPRGSARARCASCTPRDSVRQIREKLIMRIDSLRHAFEHERMTPAERERLSEEMTRIVSALKESLDQANRGELAEARAALQAMPEMAVAVETAFRQRGYLGVVFDGTSEDYWRNNERIVRFYGYPRIAMVEPSSPAERAGLLQGDTLLAFNGTDVLEREISLTKLLVPNHRITVRVRRDGASRDVRVVVGEAPAYVLRRAAPVEPMVELPKRVWEDEPRRVAVAPPPIAPDAPRPQSSSTSIWMFEEGIGGARVETLSEGLGKAVGVRSGVLVLRAAPGTPAFRSGLRDGDVIVRVEGRPVTTVRELRGWLQRLPEERGARLQIVRERKSRDLTLRWQ